MNQTTIDSKAERIAKAEKKVSEKNRKSRQKKQFIGNFGEATITDVISDEEHLEDDEEIRFELLMPDTETTKYISFSNLDSMMFEEFCKYLDVSEHDLNVLYNTVPVTYTKNNWFASFRTDLISKGVRESKLFSIHGNSGMLIYTRWMYLLLTIVGIISCAPLYLLNMTEALTFTSSLLASIVFLPAMLNWFGMDAVVTSLYILKDK